MFFHLLNIPRHSPRTPGACVLVPPLHDLPYPVVPGRVLGAFFHPLILGSALARPSRLSVAMFCRLSLMGSWNYTSLFLLRDESCTCPWWFYPASRQHRYPRSFTERFLHPIWIRFQDVFGCCGTYLFVSIISLGSGAAPSTLSDRFPLGEIRSAGESEAHFLFSAYTKEFSET